MATLARVCSTARRPAGVAAETRNCSVLRGRSARSPGFSANRSARTHSGGRTGLIGVMLSMVDDRRISRRLSRAPPRRCTSRTCARHGDVPDAPPPRARGHPLDRLMHGATDGAVLMLPRGVQRRTEGAASQGLRVRHRRPSRDARRGIPAVWAGNASVRARRRSTCSRSVIGAWADRGSARVLASNSG